MAEIAGEGGDSDEEEEEHSDDDEASEGEEVEEEEEVSEETADESNPPPSTSTSIPTLEPLTLENLTIPSLNPLHSGLEDEEEGDEEDESGSQSGSEQSEVETISHRRHRPSTRLPPPTASNVESIVTDKLARMKKSTERRHHGKKLVSSNVLGKQKGSKMKSDARRAIKDSTQF